MNFQRLQAGLIEWFQTDPTQTKSWSQIETICKKLYHQYYPLEEPRFAKYVLFYPLLRLGLIEFLGSGSYSLSPTCCLEGPPHSVFFNCPSHIISENHSTSQFLDSIKVVLHSKEIAQKARDNGIPLLRINLSTALEQIPQFDKIIASWVKDVIIDESRLWSFFPGLKWTKPSENPAVGLFRNGEDAYSLKIVKLAINRWNRVPDRQQNVDAFNIAATWASISLQQPLNIIYRSKEDTLDIRSTCFPITIERLLIVNTLKEKGITEGLLTRKYFLTPKEFKIINSLFNGQIPLI